MSEIYVTIDVHFNDSDGDSLTEHNISYFKPLADMENSSYQEKLKNLIESLDSRGHAKFRLEMLSKVYGDYLIADKIEAITPYHHQYKFVSGSDGVNFARDFSMMLFAFEPVEVKATILHEDIDDELIFTLNNDSLWTWIEA